MHAVCIIMRRSSLSSSSPARYSSSIAQWLCILSLAATLSIATHATRTPTTSSRHPGAAAAAPAAAAASRGLQVAVPAVPANDEAPPKGSDLRADDPRIAKEAPGCDEPEQVHLTLWSSTAVLVSWASCDAVLGQAAPVKTEGVRSVVFYGSSRDALPGTAEGVTTSYATDYRGTNGTSYASPLLHHVLLTGLSPGTTYYYRVADTGGASSQEAGQAKLWRGRTSGRTFSFTLPKPAAFPLQLGVIGDPGQTYNTTDTLSRLIASDPQLLIVLGDLSYSDNWLSHDQQLAKGDYGRITFEPKWDTWGRLFEPLLSGTPMLHTDGNHEISRQSNADTHTAYNHRFPTPQHDSSGQAGPTTFRPVSAAAPFANLYYSVQLPGVLTFISLTSYAANQTFSAQEEQWTWLEAELQKIDRSQTPWLMVAVHAPWYHTSVGHFKEAECMRQSYERLFVQHQVDLVLSGHVHAVERTTPIVNYKVNDCGPTYLTIGDGGNIEGLYKDYVDDAAAPSSSSGGTTTGPPAFCQDPAAWANKLWPPKYQPQACYSWQGGSFCPSSQPEWSAFREPSFGFGTLELLSPSTARWTWHKNQDQPAAWSVGDELTITRPRSGDLQRDCSAALAEVVV